MVSSAQANGITSNPLFPASAVRANVASQGTDFGYFGGGSSTLVFTLVDRVDYSNDTATASVRGTVLTVRGQSLGAVGSASGGYFGGGVGPLVREVI